MFIFTRGEQVVHGSHLKCSTNFLSSPVEPELQNVLDSERAHLRLLMENDCFALGRGDVVQGWCTMAGVEMMKTIYYH